MYVNKYVYTLLLYDYIFILIYKHFCTYNIYIYIWGVCKMLVPESGRNSHSTWGPPSGEFISHMSSFFCFISRWLNSLSLFAKIVPSLTARAYFFEVEEDSGKGQKQVRNRSETPKRQHLPSIHPSIHLISYHCYFYYYYYYFYFYYY